MTYAANAVVATYDSPQAAVRAVRRLADLGFDMANVSVLARDAGGGGRAAQQELGHIEQCWGTLRGALSGWASVEVPGVGPVLVAGPLAGWIEVGLNNAALFAGLSALGAALYNMGVGRDAALAYEGAARADRCIVLAHGSGAEVSRARQSLRLGRTLSESDVETTRETSVPQS